MADKATLTITIAYRNRALEYARRCLDSLAAQTRPDFKLHLVDYGSQPGPAQAMQTLLERFPFAEYTYVHARGWAWNKPRALNIALRRAQTAYVLNTDIDIIFAPDFVETLLQAQDGHSVVYCAPCMLPKEFNDWANVLAYADTYPRLRSGYGACQCYPLEVIHHLQGIDERLENWGNMDGDLYFRLQQWGLSERWIDDRTTIFHQWHPTIYRSNTYLEAVAWPIHHQAQAVRNTPAWGAFIPREQRPLFDILPLAESEEPVEWDRLLAELERIAAGPLWFMSDYPQGMGWAAAARSGYKRVRLKARWPFYWFRSAPAIERRVERLAATALARLKQTESTPPAVIVLDLSTFLRLSRPLLLSLLNTLAPGGCLVIAHVAEPRLPPGLRRLKKHLLPYLKRFSEGLRKGSFKRMWSGPPAAASPARTAQAPSPPGSGSITWRALLKKVPFVRRGRAAAFERSRHILSCLANNIGDSLAVARLDLPDVLDYTLDFPTAGGTAIFIKRSDHDRRPAPL